MSRMAGLCNIPQHHDILFAASDGLLGSLQVAKQVQYFGPAWHLQICSIRRM